MISNIIFGIILLWAAYYAGRKMITFVRQASDDKSGISCACAGCPSRGCCRGKCATENK